MANQNPYELAAEAVREIIDVRGGAIITTDEELRAAVCEMRPELSTCSPVVLEHIRVCLRRRQHLTTRAYKGLVDPLVLLIADDKLSDKEAERRAERYGMSANVEIMLMDSGMVMAG